MFRPTPSLFAFWFFLAASVSAQTQNPQALIQDAMSKQQAGDLERTANSLGPEHVALDRRQQSASA